ncbi:MAG: hypothetical protein ACLTSN_05280, partial [Clostridium sp.]
HLSLFFFGSFFIAYLTLSHITAAAFIHKAGCHELSALIRIALYENTVKKRYDRTRLRKFGTLLVQDHHGSK